MKILENLRVAPGITSVVGSGGKTTLLGVLAQGLATGQTRGDRPVEEGRGASASGGARVILATTTHFLPFQGIPTVDGSDLGILDRTLSEALSEAAAGTWVEAAAGTWVVAAAGTWVEAAGVAREQSSGRMPSRGSVVCVGARTRERTPEGLEKLGPPVCSFETLAAHADYVLVEADGSKRLPLKAHAPWEPVIPAGCRKTILVVGASGFGRPVGQVVHRSGLMCDRLGCWEDEPATPELVAQEILWERKEGLLSFDCVLMNQVDVAGGSELARRFEAALGGAAPVVALSLTRDGLERSGA